MLGSPLSSFQPCVQILPGTFDADRVKAIKGDKNSRRCFILNTAGESDPILFDMPSETMTSRKLAHGRFCSGEGGAPSRSLVLLSSRFIYAVDTHKAFDVVSKQKIKVPWQVSSLASSTTGHAILHRMDGAYDDGLYVLGGRDKTNRRMRADVQYLPPAGRARIWERRPPMKIARRNAAAVAIGNRIIVTGGIFWDSNQATYRECPFTEVFDGEKWTFGPSLNVPRQKHCAVAVGNSIIVLGGKSSSQQSLEKVEVWNTATQFFACLPTGLSPARSNADAIAHDEKSIFLIGGGTRAVGKVTIDPAKLTPENLGNWAPFLSPEQPPTDADLNRDDSKPAASRNEESALVTSSDEEKKEWLPEHPILPPPPVSTTLRDRHKAMSGYITTLVGIQEQYRQTIQHSTDRIKTHYARIVEDYTKRRDQEIDLVRFHGSTWLSDTERAIQQARDDVILIETQLKASTGSEKLVAAFLKHNDQDDFLDEVPSQLRCPLTLDIMTDPVVAADGNTYERAALEDWFRNSKRQQTQNQLDRGATTNTYIPRSPLTGAELESETFFPVHILRTMCRQFSKQVKGTEESGSS